jgi:hypothetical protein
MDLGRLATPRALNTLLMSPLFPPDACRWAQTMVESIICTLLSAMPVAFNASSIASRTPATDQRRTRTRR